MKIKLSKGQKEVFEHALGTGGVGNVPLKKVADMLDLLDKLKKDSTEIEMSPSQFNEIYRIANHQGAMWAVNKENADMHKHFEEVKARLKENPKSD